MVIIVRRFNTWKKTKKKVGDGYEWHVKSDKELHALVVLLIHCPQTSLKTQLLSCFFFFFITLHHFLLFFFFLYFFFCRHMAMWFARSRNLVSSLRQNLGLSAILIKRNHSSPRPVFTNYELSSKVFLDPSTSFRHESTAVESQPDLVQQSDHEDDAQVIILYLVIIFILAFTWLYILHYKKIGSSS